VGFDVDRSLKGPLGVYARKRPTQEKVSGMGAKVRKGWRKGGQTTADHKIIPFEFGHLKGEQSIHSHYAKKNI